MHALSELVATQSHSVAPSMLLAESPRDAGADLVVAAGVGPDGDRVRRVAAGRARIVDRASLTGPIEPDAVRGNEIAACAEVSAITPRTSMMASWPPATGL